MAGLASNIISLKSPSTYESAIASYCLGFEEWLPGRGIVPGGVFDYEVPPTSRVTHRASLVFQTRQQTLDEILPTQLNYPALYSTTSMDYRDGELDLISDVNPKIIKLPFPDYGKPVAELYAQLVKSYIKTYNNLDILSDVDYYSQNIYSAETTEEGFSRFPSWTPDWRKLRTISSLLDELPSWYRSQDGNSNVEVGELLNPLLLKIKGRKMDTVDFIESNEATQILYPGDKWQNMEIMAHSADSIVKELGPMGAAICLLHWISATYQSMVEEVKRYIKLRGPDPIT